MELQAAVGRRRARRRTAALPDLAVVAAGIAVIWGPKKQSRVNFMNGAEKTGLKKTTS